MKIHICNDNKVFPFLYVDDWYTPEEEKLIWKELDFYTHPTTMHRAEDTTEKGVGPAKYNDRTSLTKAWRLALDGLYSGVVMGRKEEDMGLPVSHILRLQQQKLQSDEMWKAIEETGPNFRMFEIINNASTFINYYEHSDYYDSHGDSSMISTLTWFHRKPKAYTGGDLTFTDIDVTLECKHNRIVMFPGYYHHKVSPIKMKDKNLEMGWGRYSIANLFTQFCNLPQQN